MPRPPLPFALATTAALAAAAGHAQAAAIERVVPSTSRILYEPGTYGELGVLYLDPRQSGEGANLAPLGIPMVVPGDTGDLFGPQWAFSAGWKGDIGPRLSYAILFDQPYGANTRYGPGSFVGGFPYDGTGANLETHQLSGILAYDVTSAVKLYGGVRAERIGADADIPFIADYSVTTDPDWGYGYLVGAAYERPEIALRVAFTYYSDIRHSLATDEFSAATGDVASVTDVSTPQSATLEFQSGIADRTLAFGSIRWVDWSEFDISPEVYTDVLVHMPLVDYTGDWWTYTAGIGRQLTGALAGALSVSYEPPIGGALTTLGPYDGQTTATAALSYDFGQATLSGGVTYGRLGDTTNPLDTDYDAGSIWGMGLRFGYSF